MNSKIAPLLAVLVLPFLVAPAGAAPDQAECDDAYAAVAGNARKRGVAVQDRFTQYRGPGWQRYINSIRDATKRRLQYWHGHEYPIMAMDDATPVKASILAHDAFSFSAVKNEVFQRLESIAMLSDPKEVKEALEQLAKDYARYPAEAEELARMAKNFSPVSPPRALLERFRTSVASAATTVTPADPKKIELAEKLAPLVSVRDQAQIRRSLEKLATEYPESATELKQLALKFSNTPEPRTQLEDFRLLLTSEANAADTVKADIASRIESIMMSEDPIQIRLSLEDLAREYRATSPQEAAQLRNIANAFSVKTPSEIQLDAYRRAIEDFKMTIESRPAPIFTLDEINKEVNDLLKAVEAFPENYKRFIDETATKAAEYDEIVKALARRDLPNINIKLMLPVVDVKPNGEVVVTMKEQVFDNIVQLKLYRDQLKKETENRTAQRFFRMTVAQNVHIMQAINIKKLENYRAALMRQASLSVNAGKELPPELKVQLDRINAIYADVRSGKLKDEYRLPYWAWDRLRWIQLWGEMRSIVEKDVPKLQDAVQNNKVIEYVRNMPEEERLALGISNNVATSGTILGRTKWLGVLLAGSGTAVGPFYGGYSGFNVLWEMWIGDARKRELCTVLRSDDDFTNCVQEYLQIKFPGRAIGEIFSRNPGFMNGQGEIDDPQIASVVKKMMQARSDYFKSEFYKENVREAMMRALNLIMAEKDMSSIAYRKKMVESANDDAFVVAVLGPEGNEPPAARRLQAYLDYKFPVHFKQHKEEIRRILKLEYNSDDQGKALEALRQKGAILLADEVKALLDERQTFKETGAVNIQDSDLNAEERQRKEEEDRKRREEEAKREEERKRREEEEKKKRRPIH